MNKVLIVIMFILLGTSLVVITNMNKGVENSFVVQYHNNHNLALPDLTGKAELSAGVYRLENVNGVIVDYNINSGEYIINGTATNLIDFMFSSLNVTENTYASAIYVSGTYTSVGIDNISFYTEPYSDSRVLAFKNSNSIAFIGAFTGLRLQLRQDQVFNNYTFKLQLSKGSYLLPYVVPKLLPVYKDNLTMEEKQNIGFGAFAGFTEIIRSINNIIQPVSDFINGILNLF